MSRIRRDDVVMLLAGKDKGKTGKIIKIFTDKKRALVQGVNFVKKHTRRTKEDQQGGVIDKESSIHISNLMVMCQKCNKPTRVSFSTLSDGTKTRICKKCKELI
ncbi:MAG: 50S ribosomal protein L24 [Candidatus Omnitrophota bacterium]